MTKDNYTITNLITAMYLQANHGIEMEIVYNPFNKDEWKDNWQPLSEHTLASSFDGNSIGFIITEALEEKHTIRPKYPEKLTETQIEALTARRV